MPSIVTGRKTYTATWSDQLRCWTIIRNGHIVAVPTRRVKP